MEIQSAISLWNFRKCSNRSVAGNCKGAIKCIWDQAMSSWDAREYGDHKVNTNKRKTIQDLLHWSMSQ